MKKINILFLLQLIASLSLNAQDLDVSIDTDKNERFIGVIQISYIKNYEARNSISVSGRGAKDIDLNTDNAKAYSLNVTLGYYVIPKRLSVGIGFGLDGYHEPGFNSAPLYGDVHFYLTDERNVPYIYANFGGLAKFSNNFVRGYTGKIGFGYKFFISEKLCLIADLGYSAKGASLTSEPYVSSKDVIDIKGLALSLGFVLF